MARLSGGVNEEGEECYGAALAVGKCPACHCLIAAEARQTGIEGYDAREDEWGDFVRVYPKPPKTFLSKKLPSYVMHSLSEADKAMQANANDAACVMLGRALEGVCRDRLTPGPSAAVTPSGSPPPKRPMMPGEGIRKLKDQGLIDDRLLDWSQHLQAFRNQAAHATDVTISREDAEDLQSFAYAIIEYIYDLTDRYNEFKVRMAKRKKK